MSGTWDIVIHDPEGTIHGVATLMQAGDAVTGTISFPLGVSPIAGTLSGTALTLTYSQELPEDLVLDVRLTATVSGAEMSGAMHSEMMGAVNFTGKKR